MCSSLLACTVPSRVHEQPVALQWQAEEGPCPEVMDEPSSPWNPHTGQCPSPGLCEAFRVGAPAHC